MLERDCRVDETYNEDFLGEKDSEFIAGMDFMRMSICNLFEGNLDVYKEAFENVDTMIDVVKFLDLCKYEITEMIRHWSENERNDLIVSMIDNMDEDEYNKNKEIAMQKQYEDAMDMKYLLNFLNGKEKENE